MKTAKDVKMEVGDAAGRISRIPHSHPSLVFLVPFQAAALKNTASLALDHF